MTETFDDLPLFQAKPEDPSVERFLFLLAHHGQLTRKDFKALEGWNDRTVRDLAEAAGGQVVRGPKGFSLEELTTVDEMKHAAEIAISQGKKMISYGVALRIRAHKRIG